MSTLFDSLRQIAVERVLGGERTPLPPAELVRVLAASSAAKGGQTVGQPLAPMEPMKPPKSLSIVGSQAELIPESPAVPFRLSGITERLVPRPIIGDKLFSQRLDQAADPTGELKRYLKSLVAEADVDKTLDALGYGYYERATAIPKDVLTKAEVASLAKKFAQSSLSFLVWIGSILDKPRAAVAGLLAGDPSHLLLLLPFSEGYLKGFYEQLVRVFIPSFKGIPEKRIYGRDLLEMYGIVPKRSGTGILFGGSISDLVGDILGLGLDFLLGSLVPYPAIVSTGAKAQTFVKGAGALRAEAAAHAQLIARTLLRRPDAWDEALRTNFAMPALLKHVPLPLESPAIAKGETAKLLREIASELQGIEVLSRVDPAVARQAFARAVIEKTDDIISKEIQAAISRERVLPPATPTEAIREATSGSRALVLGPAWPFQKITPTGYYVKLWEPKGLAGTKLRNAAEAVLVENPMSALVLGMFHWGARGVSRAGISMAMDATENARLIKSVVTDMQAEVNSALGSLAGQWASFAEQARFFGDRHAGLTFDSMARYAAETALVWSQSVDDSSRVIARQLLGVASEADLARAQRIIGETIEALHGVHGRLQQKLVDVLQEHGAPISRRDDLFGLHHFARFGKGYFGGQTVWPTTRMAILSHPAGTVALNRMASDPIVNARINATARMVFAEGFQAGTPALVRVGTDDYPVVLESLLGSPNRVEALRFWDGQRYFYAVLPDRSLSDSATAAIKGAIKVDDFRLLAEPPIGSKLPRVFTTPTQAEESAKRFAAAMGWEIPEKVDPVYFYVYKRYFEPIVELPEWKDAIHPVVGVPNKELRALIFPLTKEERNRAVSLFSLYPELKEALNLTTNSEVRRFVHGGGLVGNLVDTLRRVGPMDDLLYNRSLAETLESLYYHATQRLGLLIASQDYVAKMAVVGQSRPPLLAQVAGAFEFEKGMIPLEEVRKRIHWWYEPKARVGGLPLTNRWMEKVIDRFLERHGKTWQELVPDAKTKQEAYEVLAKQIYVPEFVPKQIMRVFNVKEQIETGVHDYQYLWDKYLTLMRYWLTQVSPSFHVRNFVSGQVMNLTATDVPYTLAQYRQAFKDVVKALSGKTKIPFDDEMAAIGILKGVTLAADPSRQYSLAKGGLGWVMEPMTKELVERVLWPSTKFVTPSKRAAAVQKAVAERGTLGAIGSEFLTALNSTTDRAYTLVETLNRVTPYIAARRAGLSPSQAAELVKRIQYDYSRLAPFERNVMRPLFLFYGWIRSNLGYLIPRVTLEAVSGAATIVRMLYAAQQTAGDLPAWMMESAAIPFRQTEAERLTGLTTVVRRWGLHVEDLSLIHPTLTGPGALRMLQKAISSMNPIIGAAFRLATGIEPFTGRPLKEQAGLTGYPLVDVVMGATPLARIGSMVRTTAEVFGYTPYRRQWQMEFKFAPLLDLFTGIKTGEYDLELQLLMDAREQLRKVLELSPYTRTGAYLYIPEHLKPLAPPWLVEIMDRYNELQKAARAVARARRGRDIVSIREVVVGGD